MENFNITELDDEFVIVREYAYQRPEKVVITITESYSDGSTKIIKTYEEQRRPENKKLTSTIYIFTKSDLELMKLNYSLGNCPITERGLRRYSLTYGSGNDWYGCPAKTAKRMLKKGVAVPKEAYGLFTHVGGSV